MNFFKNKFSSNKIKYFNRFVYFTGCVTIINYLRDVPHAIYNTFSSRKTLDKLKEKYGDGWVIITGGTTGIGLSFANELSRLGFKILIISRDNEKLLTTCQDIEDKYNTKAKKIQFNFTKSNDEAEILKLKHDIEKSIGNEKISMLVNNVGMMNIRDMNFGTLNTRDLIDYVSVNIISQLVMYHLFLERLKNQDSKSLILDVSSMTDDIDSIVHNVVYQSTKTFNARFSKLMRKQLQVESTFNNKPNNVDIALFKPGMTVTNLTERHKTKSLISDYSDNVVLSCLVDI
jgi:short-subunit dehydrogenase